jgi:hypothetical protein
MVVILSESFWPKYLANQIIENFDKSEEKEEEKKSEE